MTFYNKQGNCNMTNSVDIIANSISLVQPDGTLQTLTIGGTIAPVNNPTFTGTVAGVSKEQIGLGNVDNTSDLNKPISTATQSALNTVIANTNTTLTSHLGLIYTNVTGLSTINTTVTTNEAVMNNNTSKINVLNTSVSNINSTLTSQLNLINTTNNNLSLLTTSTNNTFASQLVLINGNGSSISTLNSNIVNLSSSTNNNYTSLLATVNTHARQTYQH